MKHILSTSSNNFTIYQPSSKGKVITNKEKKKKKAAAVIIEKDCNIIYKQPV